MAFLTKEQIVAVNDRTHGMETVSTAEWGAPDDVVGVGVMTGGERDYFEERIADAKDGRVTNLRALLCALTMSAPDGSRLFDLMAEWSEEQRSALVATLAEKSSAVLDRLFEVARRINKLTPEEQETLKNASPADPSDGSGSSSPEA